MRIIGGKLKGRMISPPAGYSARPTTDYAKEGLFNVLDNEYEFASRGAALVCSVEMNKANASFIRREAARLGLDKIKAVHSNVFDFLPVCHEKFDIIFADPPYALEGLESIPDKVLGGGILQEGNYFILEHGDEHSFRDHPRFKKEKVYGRVHFSFFEQ